MQHRGRQTVEDAPLEEVHLAAAGVAGEPHDQIDGRVEALDHHPGAVGEEDTFQRRSGAAVVVDRGAVEGGVEHRRIHGSILLAGRGSAALEYTSTTTTARRGSSPGCPSCSPASETARSGAPDADFCRRSGFQPGLADRGSAHDADSVGARVQPASVAAAISSRWRSACRTRASIWDRSKAIVAPSGSCSSSALVSREAATIASKSCRQVRQALERLRVLGLQVDRARSSWRSSCRDPQSGSRFSGAGPASRPAARRPAPAGRCRGGGSPPGRSPARPRECGRR